MTYPWHGWWSQCVLVVPYFTFHWFFSSMNLNDVLIFVLADFRARKIFILVWSDIIWSLQFILVSLLCVHISNIYGHIVNTVIAQKLLHLYLITQEHEIISLCKKSFQLFIALFKYPKNNNHLTGTGSCTKIFPLCNIAAAIVLFNLLPADCLIFL